jgi:hypothetical protein
LKAFKQEFKKESDKKTDTHSREISTLKEDHARKYSQIDSQLDVERKKVTELQRVNIV